MPTNITDWNDLAAIPSNATGTYVQQNDIDDTSAGYSTHATDWAGISIGSGGEYNGNGYSIEDWETSNADTAAFFTEVSGYVHDLRLARMNHDTTEPSRTAIFVGDVKSGGKVEKCHVEGFAQTTPNNYDAAGFAVDNAGTIIDCIAEANVDNQDRDAIGFNVLNSGTIKRCVSAPVALNSQGFGTLYAFSQDSGGTYTDCYYSDNVTTTDASGATQQSESDLKSFDAETTLSNYDFDTVWKVEPNEHPSLRDPAPPVVTVDLTASGSATGSSDTTQVVVPRSLTATGSSTGAGSAVLRSLVTLTASGAGTGASADIQPLRRRAIDANGGGNGVGTAFLAVSTPFTDLTASGSATGTSDATQVVRRRSMDATGNGSGDGSTTIARRRAVPTAPATASGSGTATLTRVAVLSAAGSGAGDGTAQFVLVRDGRGIISPRRNRVMRVTPEQFAELKSRRANTVLDADTIE